MRRSLRVLLRRDRASCRGAARWSVRHRRDIQGLRAVAVVLVVFRHAHVPGFGGGFVGVDVFFVLSGFLITGLLLSEVERRGTISFVGFYIRRARRILPAAALTLVVTDVAAFLLLNFVRARDAVVDSLYAGGFGANFHFATQATDYFARTKPQSPFLHYWSLSVEEQFYIVWPALISLALVGGLSAGRRKRLLAIVVVLGAASLAWSVHETLGAPVAAYFSPFSRAWELALGAALAVATPRLPARLAGAIGGAGILAVAVATVVYTESTPFPGYAALLPAVGTALVIWTGEAETLLRGVLSVRPLCFVGDRSYALYLWHWPVLIIAEQYAGRELSAAVRFALVVVAFGLSVVSYALIENPVHRARWSPIRTAIAVGAAMVVVVATALVSISALDAEASRAESGARPAAALSAVTRPTSGPPNVLPEVVAAVDAARRRAPIPSPLYPPLALLPDHERLPYTMPPGCMPDEYSSQSSSRICAFGRTSSRRSIVLVGDSHAQMWLPSVLHVAKRDGWVVYPILRRGCTPITWVARYGLDACRTWFGWARTAIARLHPNVVIVTGDISEYHGRLAWVAVRGTLALASAVSTNRSRVVILGDPDGLRTNPIDCLLRPHATMRDCTAVWWPAALRPYASIRAAAKRRRYGFVDSRGWFCYELECPPVMGRTVAYWDQHHITAAYALHIAEPFRAAFRRAMNGQ